MVARYVKADPGMREFICKDSFTFYVSLQVDGVWWENVRLTPHSDPVSQSLPFDDAVLAVIPSPEPAGSWGSCVLALTERKSGTDTLLPC